MNRLVWNKRKATIAIILCTIIAISSVIFLQNNQTTQAALINPQPTGLVGWWRFDEGSGSVAADSSIYGNNGIISQATWLPGKFGQALNFNGQSSNVQIPFNSVVNPTSAITMSAWVQFTSLNTNSYPGIFWQSDNTDPNQNTAKGLSIGYSNSNLVFFLSTSTTKGKSCFSTNPLQSNTWYYIVGTYDGSVMSLYINGVLNNTQTLTGTLDAPNNPVYIGTRGDWSFNGLIDEARIYNRALSPSEVLSNYQKGPDFSSNVLAKIPQGTTQIITTLSWQGSGTINATIMSPTQNYTESMLPIYQKTSFSTSDGVSAALNIKRLSVSVSALPSDQNWNIVLTYENSVSSYQIAVEIQK